MVRDATGAGDAGAVTNEEVDRVQTRINEG